MIEFSNSHKAIVLTEGNYEKFVEWAAENRISFQQVKTEDDANEIQTWLPSAEQEWEPSWEDSSC